MTTALVANIARPISSALSTAFNADNVGLLSGYGIIGASFSPLSLFAASEQGIWLDPSDLSTMFQDSVGTTPVTAAGQPVGKILDKSGRNNHASQATAAKRPLLQNDGVNNYLAFDGVNDALATANIDFSTTSQMCQFSGAGSNDLTTNIYATLVGFGDVNSISGSFALFLPSIAGTLGVFARGATASGQKGISISTGNHVISGVQNLVATAGSQIYGRVDGVASTTAGTTGGGVFGNTSLSIGSGGGGSYALNGRIYSLIILGRLAATQEITDTEAWVAGKTGVTLP